MRARLFDVAFLGTYLALSVGGMILIKLGSKGTKIGFGNPLLLQVDRFTVFGLASFFASFLLWLVIITRYDLSYISPMMIGLSQILILAGAVVVIGERPSPVQLIGAVVVIAGTLLMHAGSGVKTL